MHVKQDEKPKLELKRNRCSCFESNEENSIGPIFSSLFDCYRINPHINVNYVEDPDKLNSILDKIKQLSLKRHKKEKESFEIQTKLQHVQT